MNPNNEIDQLAAEFEAENAPSIDDFLKELEEKEKDLNISSQMVIEVNEAESAEEIIPDFLKAELSENKKPEKKSSAKAVVPKIENNGNGERNGSGEIAELRLQIGKLENECNELKTALHRRQTDFDNYRKRIERERGSAFLEQVGNLATQLLPVLDNLSRALDAATNLSGDQSRNFNHLLDGIVLVNQQLNEVLMEMGVEPIASVGEHFDPHFHDAVAAEESDVYSPHTVTAEFLRGYRIGEKIIRPAMVKVASAPNSNSVSVSDEEAKQTTES
jgi:molecular chaperone GrpE